MPVDASKISLLVGLLGDVRPALSAAIDGKSSGLSCVEPVINLLGFLLWIGRIVPPPSVGETGKDSPQAEGLVDS
jgi:hypothetical protein